METEMNREETIEFLEKEIKMYKKLIDQEERLIKIIPNRSEVFLEDNKDTLKELIEELKELKEKDDWLVIFFFFYFNFDYYKIKYCTYYE